MAVKVDKAIRLDAVTSTTLRKLAAEQRIQIRVVENWMSLGKTAYFADLKDDIGTWRIGQSTFELLQQILENQWTSTSS